jgi:hypothetical protein
MRIALAFLLAAAAASMPARAAGDTVKFEGVQEHCVQAGAITFGPKGRWSGCHVIKGRWFATMGILDMYQAQYCLHGRRGLEKDAEGCDRRAFLVFANRAYTPKAQVLVQRIDPGSARYDDPLVVQTPYGDILELTSHLQGDAIAKSYYLWRSGRWVPIEARSWLQGLAKRLPKGLSPKEAWPDADSMTARAALAGADERVAQVELGVADNRFMVKKVTLVRKAE